MTQAKLDKDQLAVVAGEITVFNYDRDTREYFSESVKFLAIGVGIPAHSCIDAPGENKAGYAICRTADLSAWEYVTDHRGETVYNIDTRVERVITTLGDYPSDTTPYAPATRFDKWNGQQWVTDIAVQKQHEVQQAESQKRYLMSQASIAITPLQY
ncbi:MAG: tail fiber assembly protein, partial [Enterobacteriaceae bacterium]|nr:tail fiber assembly protein [Enterobacteriaceae bacterium]